MCKYPTMIVYFAASADYFQQFGKALIRSVQANSSAGIKAHIYNPEPQDLQWCDQHNVAYTCEHITLDQFRTAADQWRRADCDPAKLHSINEAMRKGGQTQLEQRMMSTYCACQRFVKLAEIFDQPTLAIDVDAVVRKEIPVLPDANDFYIHHITGRRARFLAGGLYLHAAAKPFLREYATVLKQHMDRDDLWWGLDQDVLANIVPKYKWAQLPSTLIDWHMQPDSVIWTAKGTRKDLPSFIDEQSKYSFE
jgi:hypothetical protein